MCLPATDSLNYSLTSWTLPRLLVLTPCLELIILFLHLLTGCSTVICLLTLGTGIGLATFTGRLADPDSTRTDEVRAGRNMAVRLVLGVIFGFLGKKEGRHVSTYDRIYRR